MIRLFYREDPRVAARRTFICMSVSLAFAWIAAVALFPLALGFSGSRTPTAVVASLYVLAVVMIGEGVALPLLSRVAGPHTAYTPTLTSFLIILLWIVPAAMFSMFGGLIGICIVGAFASAIAGFLKLVLCFFSEGDVGGSSSFAFEFASDFTYARQNDANLAHLAGLICLAYIGIAAELSGNRKSAFACTALLVSVSVAPRQSAGSREGVPNT